MKEDIKGIQGHLILIEGADGSGKSSLCKRIYKELTNKGKECLIVREPGGTDIGNELRPLLVFNKSLSNLARFYGFLMDRAHLYESLIIPELNKGKVVISDRSFISTYVYQVCTGLINEDLFYINTKEILDKLKGQRSSLILLELDEDTQIKRIEDRYTLTSESNIDKPIFETTKGLRESLSNYEICFSSIDRLLFNLDFDCKVKMINSLDINQVDREALEFILCQIF